MFRTATDSVLYDRRTGCRMQRCVWNRSYSVSTQVTPLDLVPFDANSPIQTGVPDRQGDTKTVRRPPDLCYGTCIVKSIEETELPRHSTPCLLRFWGQKRKMTQNELWRLQLWDLLKIRASPLVRCSDGYGRERDYVRPKMSGKTKEGQKQSDFTISAELLTKYKYTNFISVQ